MGSIDPGDLLDQARSLLDRYARAAGQGQATLVARIRARLARGELSEEVFAGLLTLLPDMTGPIATLRARWLAAEDRRAASPPAVEEEEVDEEAPPAWLPRRGAGEGKPRPHVVRTGLSGEATPEQPLPADRTLAAGHRYWVWLDTSADSAGGLESRAGPLSVRDVEVDVVLAAIEGAAVEGPSQGRLKIDDLGRATVVTPAGRPAAARPEALAHRLFFAIRPDPAAGMARLTCAILHEGTVVQRREIDASLAAVETAQPEALQARLVYDIVENLGSGAVREVGGHQLGFVSVESPTGRHVFQFVGRGAHVVSAHFDSHEIQAMIDRAREIYRQIAWGDKGPWKREFLYRYEPEVQVQFEQFAADLTELARAGYTLYDSVAGRLENGEHDRRVLGELMRRPGTIQMALPGSARIVPPLALFYDHPFDIALPAEQVRVCPQYLRDSSALSSMLRGPCLAGSCPHHATLDIVCPAGFWGFRHAIGVPWTSLERARPAARITTSGPPTAVAAVSMDPQLARRDSHLQELANLFGADRVQITRTRNDTLQTLKSATAHVVYFYCHGGVDGDGQPFLQVGAPGEPFIYRSSLGAFGVGWTDPRPLVVLNGCHTTALEPEKAIELVTGFLENRAAGVIGTEITIFEPLATAFGIRLLQAFLLEEKPLGVAMREARLDQLAQLNPLGLVYIAFALSSLRLVSGPANLNASRRTPQTAPSRPD